eukprot:gene2478-1548_t
MLPLGHRKLVDIGVNLTDPMFRGVYHGKEKHKPDIDAVLQRAVQAGVHSLIITGVTVDESRKAVDLCQQCSTAGLRCFATVGCHPTHCEDFLTSPDEYYTRFNTDRILEGLKRDEAFQDVLYTIDAKAYVKDFLSAKPQNGKSKGAADSKKGHTVVETAKSPATSVREEYVKIALAREMGRMATVQAKQDLFDSLKAQYLDDGMTEDEAMKAAEEDLGEDEEDVDQEANSATQRPALYLCLIGYPNTVEDILEASKAKVPLDCLLNIVSKAALSGSASVETTEKPNDKGRNKGNDAAKNAGKRGRAEDEVSKYLIEQLIQRNQTRTMEEYNAADEVLVHTYEFPCDELPPRAADGPPVYRLTGSEKAGLVAISEALIQVEESLHLFREWKANRTVVHVPKYCGLLDPDAPKPAPVELVEEKNKRKRSASSSSKKGLGQPPPEAAPLPPVLTTEDLRSMSDVAANTETYKDAILQHRLKTDSFLISAFVSSCITQVSSSTTTLSDKSQRAEKAMMNSKDAVGRFADYIFNEIMGVVKSSTPKARQEEQVKQSVENAGEAPPDSMSSPIPIGGEGADSPDEAAEKAQLSIEEREKLTTPKGRLLGAEGLPIEEEIDAEKISDIIACGIRHSFPHLPEEFIAEEVKRGLFLGFAALNTGLQKTPFGRFWFYKNMHGWRHVSRKWGAYFVDVLSKGDGTARTQHLTYSFEGPTTFPEFVAEQRFCEGEKAFFYPPPAESDDEEPEEEEEEEDEEDEEGNIIPRKKKEPEPFPFLDHVSIIQRAMRKRRVNEEIIRHLATPREQETVNHGQGARCAVEEVEWMFPEDGTIVEVERSTVNTKQLSCFVTSPRGLEFGFMFCEYQNQDSIQKYVPSHIRTFVERGRSIKVMAEVVADNTVAAENMAFERAVEEAKLEARKQLETLQNAKKSARGKDKSAVLPTLAELEETCINAIPRPQVREKCPPTLKISALFNNGNTFVSFNEVEETLHIKSFKWATVNVDLPVRVWRNNRMDTVLLNSVSCIYVHADGSVEIFSPESQGYRIILSSHGSYMTEKDGQCLAVLRDGRCSLRSGESVVRLMALKCSDNIDCSTKDLVTEREDGIQLISHRGELKRAKYGNNVSVSWEGESCMWRFAGVPPVRCNTVERTFGVECDDGILSFDLARNVALITCPGEEFRALFDLIEYRLQVHPINSSSLYIIDCAFGGLYADVSTAEKSVVYRVSPFGRCSEERDGLLALPSGYVTPEVQPLMRLPEIWSPSFVETLQDTDVLVDRDALHLIESLDVERLPYVRQKRPTTNKAIEKYYESRGANTLKSITTADPMGSKVLSCTCVSNEDRSLSLIFVEPITAHLLSKTFLRYFNALYSCAFGVRGVDALHEYLLAINSNRATKASNSKVLLPSTVDDLFLATSNNTEDALLWYWLIRCTQDTKLSMEFFSNFFDPERLQKGYEDALEFLCSNLPLAQREEFLPMKTDHPTTLVVKQDCCASSNGDRDGLAEIKPSIGESNARNREQVSEDQLPGNWGGNGRLNYWNMFHDQLPVERRIEKRLSAEPVKASADDTPKAHVDHGCPSTQRIGKVNPLMATKTYRTVADTGTTASSRGHYPRLIFTPKVLDFGSIKTRRCYAAIVYLTNTSTVPCRYRLVVPKEFKNFVAVKHPRHFMAPGLTEGAEVRIFGIQPLGDMEITLTLAHEGGSESVSVRWKTVQLEPEVQLSSHALCVSETPQAFIPGTTTRFKRRNSDELAYEEENQDSSGGDDDDQPPTKQKKKISVNISIFDIVFGRKKSYGLILLEVNTTLNSSFFLYNPYRSLYLVSPHSTMELSEQSLRYNRSKVSPGIVHFGVGQFCRGHLFRYTQKVLELPENKNGCNWGIVGVNVFKGEREEMMWKAFQKQNFLYTVSLFSPNGNVTHEVLGSMIKYLYAPEEQREVLNYLVNPQIKILSLTVTEGGYNIDENTGKFDLSNAAVKDDLTHPEQPNTTFGYIVEGLRLRKEAGIPPFTVMSCDNLRHNGNVAKTAVLGFAAARDPRLADWIKSSVKFPNSMVDRITPATTDEVRDKLQKLTGTCDRLPVIGEDFDQWVIEDKFNNSERPAWEKVGLELSNDVPGYENTKVRILNSSHLMITFPGLLLGYRTVHEALADPDIMRAVELSLTESILPFLRSPVDTTAYKNKVLSRFKNPAIADQLLRIAGDGCSKVQVFWTENVKAIVSQPDKKKLNYFAFGLACFIEYLYGKDCKGGSYPVIEPKLSSNWKEVIASSNLGDALALNAFDPWRATDHKALDERIFLYRLSFMKQLRLSTITIDTIYIYIERVYYFLLLSLTLSFRFHSRSQIYFTPKPKQNKQTTTKKFPSNSYMRQTLNLQILFFCCFWYRMKILCTEPTPYISNNNIIVELANKEISLITPATSSWCQGPVPLQEGSQEPAAMTISLLVFFVLVFVQRALADGSSILAVNGLSLSSVGLLSLLLLLKGTAIWSGTGTSDGACRFSSLGGSGSNTGLGSPNRRDRNHGSFIDANMPGGLLTSLLEMVVNVFRCITVVKSNKMLREVLLITTPTTLKGIIFLSASFAVLRLLTMNVACMGPQSYFRAQKYTTQGTLTGFHLSSWGRRPRKNRTDSRIVTRMGSDHVNGVSDTGTHRCLDNPIAVT